MDENERAFDESLIPDPGTDAETGEDTVAAPQGVGGRLGDSFGALVVGLILVPLACAGLFWNEGHAVHVARALHEVQGIVRPIASDRLDPANLHAAVHVSGRTTSAAGVSDAGMGVHASGLKLSRRVEMYQWREKENGSGQNRTFSYTREWSDTPVSSGNFHAPSGHQNPAFPAYRNRDVGAPDARVDAVPVGAGAVLRLGGGEELPLDDSGLSAARRTTGRPTHASAGGYYVGENPESPRVGDLRITYRVVPEGPASFIGRQESDGLEPVRASNGQEILLGYHGLHPADVVIAKGQDDNRMFTWILRVGGLVVLLVGFAFLFAPVNVLASYVPVLGGIVSGATFLVALVTALAVGTGVIGLAWLFYRPLIAGGAILGAVALLFALGRLRAHRTASPRPVPA